MERRPQRYELVTGTHLSDETINVFTAKLDELLQDEEAAPGCRVLGIGDLHRLQGERYTGLTFVLDD